MLADSDQCNQLWMVSYFDWSNDLSFELFFRAGGVDVLFDFFNSDFSASPFSFEYFGRISVADFFFEDETLNIIKALYLIICKSGDKGIKYSDISS